ncbi:MAG: STAS domain-containing protein [Actinomycetota bacterium]|nr:STAS domain-containing protein [Actinomycetota bacterium]
MNTGRRFSAQVTHLDGSAVLRVTGELDLASAPRLQTTVDDLVTEHLRALTIDMSDLGFVDIIGLRALAAAGRTTAEMNVQYRLIGVSESVLRIIRLAEFHELERACETAPTG